MKKVVATNSHGCYHMSKSVSHVISSRDSYTHPTGDIGRGLIQHMIQILTCHVHYIIYYNHTSSMVCEGVWYFVCDIGLEVWYRVDDIRFTQTLIMLI